MSLRPKTKRRLLLLGGGGAVFAALAGVGAGYQLHRHEAYRQRFRADGMAAFAQGDDVRAIVELKKYLSDNRTDPEAIYTLAIATERVVRPEQANLIAARGLLVRYLELNPTDLEAQHRLLDLYEQLQFRYELLTLADALLARDGTDRAALGAEWRELYREGHLDAALSMARRLDEVDPADVQAQEGTLELMARLHRPPADLTARADALVAAHPADPRSELVRAVAAHLTGDDAGTHRWLTAAAARPSPDPAFTLTLAAALDRMGQWADTVPVLRRGLATAATRPSTDPAIAPLRVALVEHLWQAGQDGAALDALADVDPADRRTDARLLGLKAVLLAGSPDAAPLVAKLTARGTDPAASGWAALARAVDPVRPVEPRQAVTLCVTAARGDPNNASARYFLGRAYLRIGEPGLGLECLAQAAQLAPAWAAPRLLVAQTLLDRDQPSAAAAAARAAADRDPASVAARTVLAVIAYRTLGPTADPRPVVDALRTAMAEDPADPRLPAALLDLDCRFGTRLGHGAADVRALERRLIASPAVTPASLYRIAAVAAVHGVADADAIAARAATLPTDTAANAYDVAMALAAIGQVDRGRQLLADHAAPDWQLADLRFREASAPTAASIAALTDAWAALADANPNDLDVQRATLRSPAAALNRPLIDRTIERLHTLTGDEAVEWRLARARFLLELPQTGTADLGPTNAEPIAADAKPSVKDAAAAVSSSMAEVTRTVTWTAEPQLLWAAAREQLGDLPTAVDRLKAAVPLAPDDPAVALRLARLLVRLGRFREAADAVDPLARVADALPPSVAADVADVYRRAGEAAKAVAVLRAADPQATDPKGAADPARAVPLAQAQAAAGDLAAAAATFDRVSRSPAATLESVRAAAWFKGGTGDVAGGRATLDRLDSLPAVSAVQRAVTRGQFDAAFGDPAAARSELLAATRSAPTDPRPWAALAGFALHAGDPATAVAAADHGLALVASDPALTALRDRAQTLSAAHVGVAAQPLLDALATDPSNPAAVATLDALASTDPAAVDAVIARYPTFVPAQAVVADRLAAQGRYDDAAALIQRTVDAAPSDPAPARLLTSVWARAGRPDRAAAAAAVWRSRSLAAPQPADAALALADVQRGHPQAAVDRLAPYVTARTAMPETTAVYARALSANGRPADADALLRPLAATATATAAGWRQAWLSVIADTAATAADAQRRIAQVTPLVQPGSTDDRIALGNAWYTVGTRFNDADALRHGLDALDPLTDVSDVPTDAFVLMGGLHQELGNLPAAEAAYRRALAADPDLPRAMNNLAWVILLRDGDPAEARQLADRATALLPADAEAWSTLGQVALRQSDVAAAVAAFRTATRLAPRSPAAWAGLADAQARAGHTGDAADALDRAEHLLLPPAAPPSPTTAAQLQQVRAALGRPAVGARTVRPVG